MSIDKAGILSGGARAASSSVSATGSTGNVAADMVGAALAHYKKHNRLVKIVNLSHSYWRIFMAFMERQAPDMEIPKEGIQFNNVLIRKGTMFQRSAVECELWPIIKEEDRVAPNNKLRKS